MRLRLGELPVDMMHHGVALRIRFKLKRFSTEPVAFHLVGEETLDFLNEPINFCIHVGPDRYVAGPEVDEGHKAWNPRYVDRRKRIEFNLCSVRLDGWDMRLVCRCI